MPEVKEEEERQQLVKEYYENKLKIYREENELYDDYEVDVAFLGDSLTDGYDLKSYYPEYVVSNRGIGGETTHGLEERLKVSVYDLKPKVVVMLIGGNNLKTMFDNYEDILVGLKDNLPNTKVVLLSLTAMGQGWAHKNEIACYNNVKIKLLADKYGYTFVDLFTPLFDVKTNEVYGDYTVDGAHFTSLGYEVVTSIVKPVLDDILSN
jgi:lysophospholipase L1-like esterase